MELSPFCVPGHTTEETHVTLSLTKRRCTLNYHTFVLVNLADKGKTEYQFS